MNDISKLMQMQSNLIDNMLGITEYIKNEAKEQGYFCFTIAEASDFWKRRLMTLDTVCALMIRAKYVLFWKKMANVLPQMITIAVKNINGVTKPKPSL